MALITVGIHSNLVLTEKTKINEYGSLEIGIKVAQDESAILDAFRDNTVSESMESVFRIYPPSEKDYKGNIKSGHEIAQDFLALREQYMTIAGIFGDPEEIAAAIGGTQMLEGHGIEDLNKAIEALTGETFRNKVNEKLSTLFLNFLTSKKAFDGTVKFRMKFPRQNADKNFSTIPRNDKQGPWIELSGVPKAESNISWSDWEVAEKRNSGDPVASTATKVTEVDQKTADGLFTKKAETTAPDLG